MTIEQLDKDYWDFCSKFDYCVNCKYDEQYPCQLLFGYDKGRADAIEELKKGVNNDNRL